MPEPVASRKTKEPKSARKTKPVRQIGSLLTTKVPEESSPAPEQDPVEKKRRFAFCRNCCRRCCRRCQCTSRCRWIAGQCRKTVGDKFSEEIKNTGLFQTTTWKRLARFANGSGDKSEVDTWTWIETKLNETFGVRKQEGTKPKEKVKRPRGYKIVQKPDTLEGFSLASFVIYNDGVIADFYELDETEQAHGFQEIAAGGSAVVFKAAERQTHLKRAVKRVNKKDLENEQFVINEINVMKSLDHPNIPKLYEVFENDRHIYLCMELCRGGDLMDKLLACTALPEPMAGIILRTLLMTVNYLHTNAIVHRDIKPENVLFRDVKLRDKNAEITTSQVRLTDFGFARAVPAAPELMHTKVGSPYYVAPEVMQGEGYTNMCDVWSIGVVAYLLLCGYPPIAGKTTADTLSKVEKGEYIFPKEQWRNITKEAKHLVAHLMHVKPSKRMMIKKALEHPWIRGRGSSRLEHMREDTVDRLVTFHKHHPLRKAAMLAIAFQSEAEDLAALRDLYMSLDLNGDGILQRSEFMKAVQSCGVDEHFIQEMIRSVDADASGFIDYTEFIASTIDKEAYLKNHAVCLRAFRCFDQDDSGGLSMPEVAQILDMSSLDHQAEVEMFFKIVDENKDGVMDYLEFYVMLQVEIDALKGGVNDEEAEDVDEERLSEDHALSDEEEAEFDIAAAKHKAVRMSEVETMAATELDLEKRNSSTEGMLFVEADVLTNKKLELQSNHPSARTSTSRVPSERNWNTGVEEN